ncbi:hypothetical protein B2A_01042 [mine drainage metagenome]|uniref:Transposase IS66 C-terminal domain-containing protein n=1 Tax=mine drainage metagenome TaxID=410659 RepID=T1B1H8_9ZZZZ
MGRPRAPRELPRGRPRQQPRRARHPGPVVGRKNYYGSGSIWAATLAERAWTITATASRAHLNPLEYLHAYLDACATSGAKAPSGEALARFLPWAVSKEDLATWSNTRAGPAP